MTGVLVPLCCRASAGGRGARSTSRGAASPRGRSWMGSLTVERPGSQTPRVRVRRRGVVRTLGPDAVRLAESCGLFPDEWQREGLEDGLAERADGSSAASSVAVIASRQNGKNVKVEVRE